MKKPQLDLKKAMRVNLPLPPKKCFPSFLVRLSSGELLALLMLQVFLGLLIDNHSGIACIAVLMFACCCFCCEWSGAT